jgi:hypothetical protein
MIRSPRQPERRVSLGGERKVTKPLTLRGDIRGVAPGAAGGANLQGPPGENHRGRFSPRKGHCRKSGGNRQCPPSRRVRSACCARPRHVHCALRAGARPLGLPRPLGGHGRQSRPRTSAATAGAEAASRHCRRRPACSTVHRAPAGYCPPSSPPHAVAVLSLFCYGQPTAVHAKKLRYAKYLTVSLCEILSACEIFSFTVTASAVYPVQPACQYTAVYWGIYATELGWSATRYGEPRDGYRY